MIQSINDWLAAAKQQATTYFWGTRTTIANAWFSLFGLAGQPGAGTLAGSNTANGVVPTDATDGFPKINAFLASAKGIFSSYAFNNTVACKYLIFDLVFKAGAYAFNANTTLASQPSYSSRMPGGTDFTNTEIWVECVTAFTGNLTLTVTYTNQDGTAGRSTGSFAPAVAPTVGRMFRLPLQAGDTGVQKVESVVSTVASAGTFNVLVLRRLAAGRVGNNGLYAEDFTQYGEVEVFEDSAIGYAIAADSTSSGNPELFFTVANK